MIFPDVVSTPIMPPAPTLPSATIASSATLSIPISEAIVTKPSSVIWYLAGRNPFLSRAQIAQRPSDKINPAGPSHASICIELNS